MKKYPEIHCRNPGWEIWENTGGRPHQLLPPLGLEINCPRRGSGRGCSAPKTKPRPIKHPPAQTICAPHLCIFIHLDLDDFLAEYRSFQRGLFCPASSSSCCFCILKRVFSNRFCVVDVFFENVFDIVGCLIGHVVSRSWCKGPKGALM